MSRGMELSFNMLVIAIVVGFVLAVLVLIFVDNARTFNENVQANRCEFDCELLETRVQGVSVSRPDSVSQGVPAIFRVVDPQTRFAYVYLEVEKPAELLSGAVSSVQQLTPGEGGGSVHIESFFDTFAVGSYAYTLIGVAHDASEQVIEKGTFVVTEERAETITVGIDAPERLVSPNRLAVLVSTDEPALSGRLVFTSVDDVVTVLLSPSDEYTLVGSSIDGLDPGVYILEPSDSAITTDKGTRPIDRSVSIIVRVAEPEPCETSSSCSEQMPFCADQGDGLVCTPVCAAAGERAAESSSCCADLRLEDGVCTLPGKPLRLVLVPIGVSEERIASAASDLEAALKERSPLNECSSSRLSVETAQASCARSCGLAQGAVTDEEFSRCLDTVLACGMDVRLDLDLVIGVVGSGSMTVGEREPIFGHAEVGGRRIMVADPQSGDILHSIGLSYGLGSLACGYPSENTQVCTGPNFADCGPDCTTPGAAGCMIEEHSSELIMASCERERFGDSASDLLARNLAFVRATEVCR